MKAFVAFRYPHSKAYFIRANSKGTEEFRFSSFKGNLTTIIGNKEAYDGQLNSIVIESTSITKPTISSKDNFVDSSEKLKEKFKHTNLKKLVLSRVIAHPIKAISYHTLFESLCNRYREELVYVAYVPNYGIWCGASPELLADASGDVFKTVALAGTKKTSSNRSWTSKEIQEQVYVKNFISESAQSNGFDILDSSETFDKKTGNLLHLCTSFALKVPANQHQNFVDAIHPTPAIAGYPIEESLQLIDELERHERLLYCGYLGLKTSETLNYFVNLRCMQLIDGEAYIYVGGGHTFDSDIESEWQETINKSNSMLDILNSL